MADNYLERRFEAYQAQKNLGAKSIGKKGTVQKTRRVFVTGGAGGIGKAIVKAFRSAGHRVAFCDINGLMDIEEENGNIFQNPLHQRILLEFRGINIDKKFNAEKYFANHVEPDISVKVAELLADKYTLSRMYTKQEEYSGDPTNLRAVQEHQVKLEFQKKEVLAREINIVIHEYKAAIISNRERKIDKKIKEAQDTKNFDEIMNLMRQKQIIIEQKKALSKEIGGRVVLWRR